MIAISFITFEPCHAQEDIAAQAVVREARLDSLIVLAAPRSLFPRALADDPDLVRAGECIAAAKEAGFAEILSDAAQKIMSAPELELAHAFYKSPLGKKYSDSMIWQGRVELGLSQTMPQPAFSKEEEYLATQFLGSTAGRKLTVQSLIVVPQTSVHIFELVAQIVSDCRRQ